MNNPLVRHHRDVSSSARAMLGRLLSCLIAVLSMAGAALAEPVRIGGTGVGSALFERLRRNNYTCVRSLFNRNIPVVHYK